MATDESMGSRVVCLWVCCCLGKEQGFERREEESGGHLRPVNC